MRVAPKNQVKVLLVAPALDLAPSLGLLLYLCGSCQGPSPVEELERVPGFAFPFGGLS
jgi:hypothetical protein